ncbi:MAG: succinylglutamate desuccinylase/aspartoacylase family protein [Bacteroidia bacterium]|nr:succinylglutamate desuccinylase/aspartoacylase family protein [Bacteroidia bacterium]
MQEQQERIIVSWGEEEAGPLVCFFAGIHGNEPAGVLALERVKIELSQLEIPFRGRLMGLRGNLEGLRQQMRYVAVDLNRLWSKEQIARVMALDPALRNVEERELLQLLTHVEEMESSGHSPRYYVDLHTTSASGGAFSVVSRVASHRALAEHLPVPIIFGLSSALAHTTNRFFEERGMVGIAFEAGQHDDPASVDGHEAAVWMMLVAAGCVDQADVPDWNRHVATLQEAGGGLSHFQQVAYRHAIEDSDEYRMIPGFHNFQTVSQGQPMGFDLHGEVFSPADGRILMPLYQPQGHDGFFIIQDLDEPPV